METCFKLAANICKFAETPDNPKLETIFEGNQIYAVGTKLAVLDVRRDKTRGSKTLELRKTRLYLGAANRIQQISVNNI